METVAAKILKAWPVYASIIHWRPAFNDVSGYDYPLTSLPVDQKQLSSLSDDVKQALANCLWIQYNRRTIDAEEYIANPAIDWLLREVDLPKDLRTALMQTAVDERYHTYFHSLALDEALTRSAVNPKFTRSVTVRELTQCLETEPDLSRRNLIQLAYAAVAEVSVNAFLEILSTSKEIKESNRKLVHMHNMDEKFHSSIFVEIIIHLLNVFPRNDSDFLVKSIKNASLSFLKHDFSMYQSVFHALDINLELVTTNKMMTRDMSGIEKLIGKII